MIMQVRVIVWNEGKVMRMLRKFIHSKYSERDDSKEQGHRPNSRIR
jgi:hypothetical protein